MARCDQGYLCKVCGEEVEWITDSSLYLRYVLGEVAPEELHLAPELHLRCNAALSQFISDPRMGPALLPVDESFAMAQLDPEYVARRMSYVSKGYRRLWEIRSERSRFPTVHDYPLPEVLERWNAGLPHNAP